MLVERLASRETAKLLDELAGATDPEAGATLACSVVKALVERGAAVAVTTHYQALKALAAERDDMHNASVGFDFERMAPTFRMKLGVPGSSNALEVYIGYIRRKTEAEGEPRLVQTIRGVGYALKPA